MKWFADLRSHADASSARSPPRILKEINERLGFLINVGLEYLTLTRASGTLSGGESQRIRLATQIGSGLTGVLYVLDEPSIGLHQRDNERLLETLRRLRDLGNTVLVVEHDEEAIRAADYLIDMGPGAGVHGGARGRRGHARGGHAQQRQPDRPIPGRDPADRGAEARRGRHRTRQPLAALRAPREQSEGRHGQIPLGTFTCVTGVSGGGKSTLIVETLYKALAKRLNNAREQPGAHTSLEGVESRQDRRHRPVADRPHAALQPRDLHRFLRADPRLVRRAARVEGARL